MFPSADPPEAGPSTMTRALRSRSPSKETTTPLIRPTRSRLPKSRPSMDEGAQRSSPTSSSSFHTATSGPLPGPEPTTTRPRRTYSRKSRAISPDLTSLAIPAQPFLHGNPTPSSPKMPDSRSSSPLSSPSKTPVKSSPLPVVSDRKGKGRAVPATVPRAERSRADRKPAPVGEKRVLPARIRRAAGTGAEGIRDLEEMVVDWLERWGEPVDTPPDSLVIHLTTLPLGLIDPPLSGSPPEGPAPPLVDVSAQSLAPSPIPRDDRERIEVPKWRKVKAGEDDEEEARDELQTLIFTQRAGKGSASPVKRLRHATAETPLEDTSDAYYLALHKKYEVFERRQRIREKETLHFERYKMRSRIDLLRGMSKTAWAALVSVVLSRSALGPMLPVVKRVLKMGEVEAPPTPPLRREGEVDRWARGRVKIEEEGPDWLRDTLVKEGEEVMRRYDELLPPEHRKSRIADMSPARTTSQSPSLSPPPAISLRVSALRDASSSAPKRKPPPPHPFTTTPKRLTLTLKARPPGARLAADPLISTEIKDSGGRKRKRTDGDAESDRRTRTRDVGDGPRRASFRSSTPQRSEEDVEMDESDADGVSEGSERGNIVATIPRDLPMIKLHTPPISIRISRSSGTPTIVAASGRPASGAPAGGSRSLRSSKSGAEVPPVGTPVLGVRLESSPDEVRERREVEAAVM